MKEYTVSEYAKLKNVHISTVYGWIKDNKLTTKRIGTVWIILSDEVN
jgi:excisionase family DNA binding protein